MKKTLIRLLIWTIVCAIIGYGVGVGIAVAQSDLGFSTELLGDRLALILLAVGALAGFCCGIYFKPKKKKSESKGKTADGKEYELHFNAEFLTRDGILSNNKFINQTWSSLPALKWTGSIFRNELVGSKLEVSMKDEWHTLVIGTTGTGKTSMVIDPAIRIQAHSAEKPSIVVTDPKGELYARHAKALMEEGYDVQVYDLNNPYVSARWNPMSHAFDVYQRANNLYKEARKYSGCTPAQAGKHALDGESYGEAWFEFEGIAYPDEESLNRSIASKKQQLINEVTQELRSVATAVCPVSTGTNDSIWEQGANDFLYGIMIAMLEDSVDSRLGENKLKRDQFNFYNLYKIANFKDADPDNPFNTVRRFCSGRDTAKSPVMGLTSGVINSAPTTTKSYMSVLAGKISQLMEDMGICYATSGTDIDFNKFVDRPTAFFIKVPDHKKERHPLATICIGQLYKTLIDISNTYPDFKLPRHVYFYLDEFGNLPVIEGFDNMVAVARSRNVLFEIVLQAYSQLDTKYGKEKAETIRNNFNIQIFLGTEDTATREAFSKQCGEVQLITKEEQTSKTEGKDQKSTTPSTNTQKSVRPLVDPYELSVLPMGTAIVKVFRQNPIKYNICQFHRTPQFIKCEAPTASYVSHSLDEDKVYYDITKRNQVVLGRPSYF